MGTLDTRDGLLPVALQSGEQVFGMRNGLSTLGAPNTTLADNLSSEDKRIEFCGVPYLPVRGRNKKAPRKQGQKRKEEPLCEWRGFILNPSPVQNRTLHFVPSDHCAGPPNTIKRPFTRCSDMGTRGTGVTAVFAAHNLPSKWLGEGHGKMRSPPPLFPCLSAND
jgi:hypothetical protein